MVEYICEKCDKVFNRKFNYEVHLNKKIDCSKNKKDVNNLVLNNSSIPPTIITKPTIIPPITSISSTVNNIDENNHNKCIKCNKKFTRSDNYNRHILYRCKFIDETIKKDDNSIIDLLHKMEERYETKIEELKNTINELKATSSSSVTNNNNNNNNSNNTTNTNSHNTNNITNNIKIIAFGFENPSEVLMDKEIQYIIGSHKNTMIQRSIQSTHFNSRLPQFHNVYIPDKKMQHAIIHNGNKPELKGLDGVIDDLLLNHVNNLDEIKNREDVSITEAKAAEIDDVVDNFRSYKDTGSATQKWIYKKAEREIKEMLYNNKDKAIDTQNRAKKRKQVKA